MEKVTLDYRYKPKPEPNCRKKTEQLLYGINTGNDFLDNKTQAMETKIGLPDVKLLHDQENSQLREGIDRSLYFQIIQLIKY